ncbi:MAG TPA: hypothetical protein VGM50_20925 [Gemmatimonadaceae bacterium]|jgi:membrane associated rhomboid family serine protease
MATSPLRIEGLRVEPPRMQRPRIEQSTDVRFIVITVGVAVAVFVAMLVFLEIGRNIGARAFAEYGQASHTGAGSASSAVYSLLALLMGFTFSGAATRFIARQDLVVQEVGAIETAWSRLDTLPAAAQPKIRDGMRRYTDAVIAAHPKITDSPSEQRDRADAAQAGHEVWALATTACLAPDGEKARMLVLPSLGDMFSISEREHLSRRVHPPLIIFVLIGVLILAASIFAGFDMSTGAPNRFHIFGVAATIALAVYLILELEFPNRGLFRIRKIYNSLITLRATMQ